ncbi:MAG: CDP-alcohol phosphatidyltransferase family protein [Acidobacteriota bacterium]
MADKFEYRKSLKKDNSFNMFKYLNVEKYINRPVASLIVKAVFNTSITPNQITYFSFFLGLAGAVLLAMGSYLYIVMGGILVQLSSVFDCSDGMLARSRGGGTEFGKYLDLFLDRITDFIIFSGVVAGVFKVTGNTNILILGLFAIGLYMLQVNLFYINNLMEKKGTGETGEARALAFFIVMIFSFLNMMDIVIYILSVEVLMNLVFRVFYFLRAGRQ